MPSERSHDDSPLNIHPMVRAALIGAAIGFSAFILLSVVVVSIVGTGATVTPFLAAATLASINNVGIGGIFLTLTSLGVAGACAVTAITESCRQQRTFTPSLPVANSTRTCLDFFKRSTPEPLNTSQNNIRLAPSATTPKRNCLTAFLNKLPRISSLWASKKVESTVMEMNELSHSPSLPRNQ